MRVSPLLPASPPLWGGSWWLFSGLRPEEEEEEEEKKELRKAPLVGFSGVARLRMGNSLLLAPPRRSSQDLLRYAVVRSDFETREGRASSNLKPKSKHLSKSVEFAFS